MDLPKNPPTKQSLKRKLDVTNMGDSLWLVKIPQGVAEKWRRAASNETLGTLKVTSVPSQHGNPPSHRLSVNLVTDNSGNSEAAVTTEEFTIDEVPSGPQIYAFEHDKVSNRFSVKGRVSKRYNLKPKLNEKYRQVVRNRLTAASVHAHQIKVTDNQVAKIGSFGSKEVDFIPPAYVDARKRDSEASGNKRSKGIVSGAGDMKEIRKRMLRAFASQEHLTFKEINSACQATESELRELLKQYAVYHNKGSLKNHYQLKAEYRQQGGAK